MLVNKPELSIADRARILFLALRNNGFIDAEISAATKYSFLNGIVDKMFPLTRIPSDNPREDEEYLLVRERFREGLYDVLIKPYEALLNQN